MCAHLHNRIYPRQIVSSSNTKNWDCVFPIFCGFPRENMDACVVVVVVVIVSLPDSFARKICLRRTRGSFVGERMKKKKKEKIRLKIIRTGIKFVKRTGLITKALLKTLLSIKYTIERRRIDSFPPIGGKKIYGNSLTFAATMKQEVSFNPSSWH